MKRPPSADATTYVPDPVARVGDIVHVAGPGFASCRPGVVLVVGSRAMRLRVMLPSAFHAGGSAGRDDEEGDYRHASDPTVIPPQGRYPGRTLPTWHRADDPACPDRVES